MAQSTEDQYRGEAGQRYQQQKRAVPEQAVPWVIRLRAEKFSSIGPQDSVVEFGAGFGWNLAGLNCARKIATDLEDFLPPEVKKTGVEFLPASQPLPENLPDVVICHHVLEHVESPIAMLQNAKRVLKNTGQLLLHVPFEKERKYRKYDPNEPNHHLFSWNVQTMGNLVASQGFEIMNASVTRFGYDRFAAKAAVRYHLGEKGFRLIRRLAHLVRPGLEVSVIATRLKV